MPPKIAIVTGSSRGLGQALACLLSEDGYVVICAQRYVTMDENKAPSRISVRCVYLDLRCERRTKGFCERMKDELPYLSLLVNNAGTCPPSSDNSTAEHWRSVMHVNFFGPLRVTEQLRPLLRRCPGTARVVNISSGDGELVYFGKSVRASLEELASKHSASQVRTGIESLLEKVLCGSQQDGSCELIFGDQPAYKLSKAALNVYTRVASSNHRVSLSERVEFLAVCPGDVDTEMADDDVPLISPMDAAWKMRSMLDLSRSGVNGSFFGYGVRIPW